MNKIKTIYTTSILLTINTFSFANEKNNYDFHELSYGINGSSLNLNKTISYDYSKSLSDKFYFTSGLTQSHSTKTLDPIFFTKAEVGIGEYVSITDKTEVYIEFSYSEYWLHNLENKLVYISLK